MPSAVEEKATQLLTEAVKADSMLVVSYSLNEMFVGVSGTRTQWRSEESVRTEAEMTEALKQFQTKGMIEDEWFGRGGGGSKQYNLRPTASTFRRFGDS